MARPSTAPAEVREALAALGVDRLLLAVHDASFPADPDEDVGRGAPGSRGAERLMGLAARLGFTGLQLGPQGLTEDGNPSPYDGAHGSRNPDSIALAPLVEDERWYGLLGAATLAELVATHRPPRADRAVPRAAHAAVEGALLAAQRAFRARRVPALVARHDAFRAAHAGWLERDALFDVLARRHGHPLWWRWSEAGPDAALDGRLLAPHPGEEAAAARRRALLAELGDGVIASYRFAQWLAHEQHAAVRARAAERGLALYGDLQVGASLRDAWAGQGLFLAGYRLGAPPSRTNPEGQAWDYPLLRPETYEPGGCGAGRAAFRERLAKAFAEYDGLRIDHPHGYVCPWVYRADDPRPGTVAAGARLFESPHLADHPELAAYARVAPRDLTADPAEPRYGDGWVARLSAEQVDRYAVLVDGMVEEARAAGAAPDALVMEVLSTLPYPLARVLARHGLGRFRVLEKADPGDPRDVYHAANAAPEDWVMLGTHDTPSIWELAETWRRAPRGRGWAERLARQLAPDEAAAVAERLAADAGTLVHALFADALASPARNAMVFFVDLFGMTDRYNVPGTVSGENWVVRLPYDFASRYAERVPALRALDLPFALALALRMRCVAGARSAADDSLERALLARCPAAARWPLSRTAPTAS